MKPLQKKTVRQLPIENTQEPDYWKNKYIRVLKELVLMNEQEMNRRLLKIKERS